MPSMSVITVRQEIAQSFRQYGTFGTHNGVCCYTECTGPNAQRSSQRDDGRDQDKPSLDSNVRHEAWSALQYTQHGEAQARSRTIVHCIVLLLLNSTALTAHSPNQSADANAHAMTGRLTMDGSVLRAMRCHAMPIIPSRSTGHSTGCYGC